MVLGGTFRAYCYIKYPVFIIVKLITIIINEYLLN